MLTPVDSSTRSHSPLGAAGTASEPAAHPRRALLPVPARQGAAGSLTAVASLASRQGTGQDGPDCGADRVGLPTASFPDPPAGSVRRRRDLCAGRELIEHDEVLDLAEQASARSARELRKQFELWLRAAGAAPTVTDDLGLAVYEALANVAEHAYPPDHPNPVVRLRARLGDDRVQVTISDQGSWSPPADHGFRGRGLVMMRRLATHCDIEPGPLGTTVQLHAPLNPAGSEPLNPAGSDG
jgi:serine/threonine-protein kinase RsbW